MSRSWRAIRRTIVLVLTAMNSSIDGPAHTLPFGVDRAGKDILTITGAFGDVHKTLGS